MNLNGIDVSRCQRPEKQVNEGLCLSYDLIRGVCLETLAPCVALLEPGEAEEA